MKNKISGCWLAWRGGLGDYTDGCGYDHVCKKVILMNQPEISGDVICCLFFCVCVNQLMPLG